MIVINPESYKEWAESKRIEENAKEHAMELLEACEEALNYLEKAWITEAMGYKDLELIEKLESAIEKARL